jgi:hypothetical protein
MRKLSTSFSCRRSQPTTRLHGATDIHGPISLVVIASIAPPKISNRAPACSTQCDRTKLNSYLGTSVRSRSCPALLPHMSTRRHDQLLQ